MSASRDGHKENIHKVDQRSHSILRDERARRIERPTSDGGVVEPLNDEAIPVSSVHFHEQPSPVFESERA